jgi:predicted porin
MKKTAIALALLGGFAGTAFAQSNMTIYGVVDVGFAHEDDGNRAGSVTRLDSGWLNGSRLGFKGREDLGGGLAAIFTLESGFSTDTGTLGQGGRLFGRQSWLGLEGGFGTVKLGLQWTPVYTVASSFDPFGDALAGDSARLFNYSGSRRDNVLSYNYAANGFRGQLQYGFGEVPGSTSASRAIGGYAGYMSGPLDTVLTYTANNDATGSVTGKTALIGGNYNFGPAALFLAYAWNKDITPVGAVSAGADSRNALIGFTMPIGTAGKLRASYIKLSDKARSDADANQIAVGYSYDLSKRTALYASMSRIANDRVANYRVSVAGANDKLVNFGVRHTF